MKAFLSIALVLGVVAAPARPEKPPVKPFPFAEERRMKPVTVPLLVIKSKHIAIQIKINGTGPYRVIFDTGAPVILINNKIAKASGVLPKKQRPSPLPFGITGPFPMKLLQIGDLQVKNLSTVVIDHPSLADLSKEVGPIDGLVGFPFFARYRMTIDYQAKTLALVPTPYQPPDVMKKLMKALLERDQPSTEVLVPAAQWGFKVYKDDEDTSGIVIKTILPGSAAARAGLEVGDRLLSLDGRWTDTVADCYRAASHVKPGTAAKVVVQRKGKEIELTVKPVAGI
jgi:hypothetical protein